MMDDVEGTGRSAARNALSWLGPRRETHLDQHIVSGFSAALEGGFDVSADGIYIAEPRLARLHRVDWSASTTPDIHALGLETVTFSVSVPASVTFTTRFDFPETRRPIDGDPSLGFKILDTTRSFVFPVTLTIGLVSGRFGEPDVRAVVVERPSITALYGPVDAFEDYHQQRT
jgi:hypothetical protein